MDSGVTNNVIYINKCNQCGKPLKDDWKFCPYCKIPVDVLNCCFCGRELKIGWNYCPYCKNECKTDVKSRLRADKCNEWLRDILKNR